MLCRLSLLNLVDQDALDREPVRHCERGFSHVGCLSPLVDVQTLLVEVGQRGSRGRI
jgi:hypothetical protein